MAVQAQEKLLSEVMRGRRATPNFEPTPVPDQDLNQILEAGLAAPSGYNLQPWRFVVVRDPEQRKRLRTAAMNQAKVEQAPVVIVACGDTQGWKGGDLDAMLRLAKEHGYGDDKTHASVRSNVTGFLGGPLGSAGGLHPDLGLWVNRHVMIAFTHMMLMAEALGYDTAPMEGFFEDQVKQLLRIPASVRVVALLAIGRRRGPDKPYAGRFDPQRLIFAEEWGKPLF